MKVTAPIPAHNEEATIEAAVAHANAARVSSTKQKNKKKHHHQQRQERTETKCIAIP